MYITKVLHRKETWCPTQSPLPGSGALPAFDGMQWRSSKHEFVQIIRPAAWGQGWHIYYAAATIILLIVALAPIFFRLGRAHPRQRGCPSLAQPSPSHHRRLDWCIFYSDAIFRCVLPPLDDFAALFCLDITMTAAYNGIGGFIVNNGVGGWV